MTTLAEIVQRYGSAYRAHYHDQLLPSHTTVLTAIAQCRTAALGGHIYTCTDCGVTRYCYHSCRNRHCPLCQHSTAQRWLEHQRELLLPVPYFLITFTLPSELRPIAYSHQRQVYTLFFRASAAAMEQLAADPRFVGGRIGMLGVLQTWTRDLRYHPHIHYLVPAIGLAADGRFCRPRNPGFLVPAAALAVLFRAKLRAALCQTDYAASIPATVWKQPWVVDCRSVGSGITALKYLAPYIFRVALSNNRIVRLANDRVTFRYVDGATRQPKTCTLPALAFLHRFLQHVLPRGFVKVRQFGLFSRSHRTMLAQLRAQLAVASARASCAGEDVGGAVVRTQAQPALERCPVCGQVMQARVLVPQRSRGPPKVEDRAPKKRRPDRASRDCPRFGVCYNHPESGWSRGDRCDRARAVRSKPGCRRCRRLKPRLAGAHGSQKSGVARIGPRLTPKRAGCASASFNDH